MAASGTQAIDRAAELLSLVVLADEPRAFSDLVSDTGLAKSTASRLLQALERHRLVHKADEAATRPARCSPSTPAATSPIDELIWLAQPALEALGRRHRRDRQPRDRPAATPSCRSRRSTRRSCSARPTGSTSTSRRTARRSARSSTPLAPSPLPREPMERRTDRTVTDPAELARELEQIRTARVTPTRSASSRSASTPIAAPVLDRGGDVDRRGRRLRSQRPASTRSCAASASFSANTCPSALRDPGHATHDQTRKEGAA